MGIGVHKYGTDYSGTSATRPLNPPTGEVYYDTTLEQLVMWVGYSWVKVATPTWEAHTSGDTLTAAESSTKHDNTGATGAVTLVLPAAVVGLNFLFKVVAVQELRLDPNGTETIALPSTGVQGAAGKYLTANAAGEYVQIRCDATGEWKIATYSGTWTAEA